MPDPSPEQPPSWPPASEPAATPTNPPRIRARGVGHLPSVAPAEETQGEADPHQRPAPPPGDYADLTADVSAPAPEPTGYYPEPEPEPHESEWGGGDMSGQWPPPENQDWISQQARNGGWGAQNPTWPPPTPDLDPPEATPDQSYRPGPESQFGGASPAGAPQAQAPSTETYFPDPAGQQPQQAGAVSQAEAFHGPGARQDPQARTEAFQDGGLPQQRRPGPAEAAASPQAPAAPPPAPPAEPAPEKKAAAPPTHAGVRYAIYGIGGIITLGMIIAIVLMLGGPPANEPSEDPDAADDGPAPTDDAAAGALDAEQYSNLASAVGTDAWFDWRFGEAGQNAATEEVEPLDGDGVASGPLLGEADRSVQGQLTYVTDQDGLSGVDHVTAVEANDTQVGLAPRAGGRFSEDGSPELELEEGATADCLAALGVDLGFPVAVARPDQGDEVNAHSVLVFSSGVLATAGVSGAQGGTCLALPSGHVPTDVALTDGNEVALVTTWQPETQTGSLVVVALADQAGKYNSSWSEPYPGLPNPGAFGSAEVMGTVELPFTAPTSVDAWSDSSGSIAVGRTTVEENPHPDTIASEAYALVGSQAERQVAVVDLASTLAGLAASHLEGAEFAFDAAASEPLTFESEVADVAVDGQIAGVATKDGLVHELGRDLVETGAVEVGPNPTCLSVGAQSGEFIVTSRGDGSIAWVADGAVAHRLADSRLTDPVCAGETPAIDVAGYGGSATILLVSDYGGQALHAYLVGAASLAGGGTVGGDGFAYAGAYEVSGSPYDVSVTVDLE